MGFSTDKTKKGSPRNSNKRDWLYYTQVGGKGGGLGVTNPGVTRYAFWIDHNKFATFIRQLIIQATFKIWSTAWTDGMLYYPLQQANLYLFFDQSNDAPDEVIRAKGQLLTPDFYTGTLTANVNYITQPSDPNFQTDQGKYVINAYVSNGLGLGNNNKIVQSFVPQSNLLTGIWFQRLFRAGTLSDESKYHNIIVEVWDKNKNVIASMIIDKRAGIQKTTDYHTEYYQNVNGTNYWTDYDQIRVRPLDANGNLKPVQLEVGATQYICVRQDVSTATHDYAVGANTALNGLYNGLGRYIFGEANVASYAGNTLTAIGTDIDICFTTQRKSGRTCATFLWDDPNYWWYDPSGVVRNQFKFIKENFDQVI